MLSALMVFTFVSPDGRLMDVAEDGQQLREFALQHRLISRPNNISNVYKLLDPASGKKQLNYYVPLSKLKWLKKVDDTTRSPEPVLGGTPEFFVGSVVPMIPDMNIAYHTNLARLLNGKYTKPNLHGWAVANLSEGEARAQLIARQARQVICETTARFEPK